MNLKRIYISILAALLGFSCAKQSSPTGGPKDLDPPVVLVMNPVDQSLNVKPERISILFDEYIKLENANRNIIVTPRINKDKVVFTALKTELRIDLNQELEDSTTYVFNFQKSVQDLSEGNPVENLKLVFSTGASIDSLKFEGGVNFYFPKSKKDFLNVIVGLFPLGDSTDVFTAAPYYLTQVDTAGQFSITNIKAGQYKAYAWSDDNNSSKAEYKSEAFDFITDTIQIHEDIEGVIFNLSKGDQTPLNFLRSSTTPNGYTIVLNKQPLEVEIENERIGDDIFYITTEKKIDLYSKSPITDSLEMRLILMDSIGHKVDSTVWTKFEKSERKPDKLTFTSNSGTSFYKNIKAEFSFNKPIMDINYDSLYISYDTASIIPITKEMVSFKDSLKRDKLLFQISIPDSIPYELFTINAADSTFKDIQQQFNTDKLLANYKKLKRETLADGISGRIEGAEPPFIVQLLDSRDNVKYEEYLEDSNEFSFQLVEATNYKIRVIMDSNGNKRWDPANYFKGRYAERIFYYKNPESNNNNITVRGGWTLEDQVIIADPPTGLKTPQISVDN